MPPMTPNKAAPEPNKAASRRLKLQATDACRDTAAVWEVVGVNDGSVKARASGASASMSLDGRR